MKLDPWWISFASEEGFLGVCIVEGVTFDDALQNAWSRGCNPGGEAQGTRIPIEDAVGKWEMNHLYTKDELMARGDVVKWETP